MLMLNYPFPYDSAPVATRFGALARVLARAVTGLDGNQRVPAATLTACAEARAALQAALSADDYRYLSFQLWQERVAPYLGYRAAAVAARGYPPSPGFRAPPDYPDYRAAAERLRRSLG